MKKMLAILTMLSMGLITTNQALAESGTVLENQGFAIIVSETSNPENISGITDNANKIAQKNNRPVESILPLPTTSNYLDKQEIFNYSIYLPPGYSSDKTGRKYPVLYLLHGAGDDCTGWVQFGEVRQIADKLINEGKVTPMIIVMPEGYTATRYFDDPGKKYCYETFFFKEFIPAIEKTYPIRSAKEFRAIAGLSMGGCGTIIYAMHHPDYFSAACPLSARIRGFDKADDIKLAKNSFPEIKNDDEAWEYMKPLAAIHLLKDATKEQKAAYSSVRWYIDCGDDDFLFEGNCLMHMQMRKLNIPHEYRVRNGGHTWTYWRTALPDVLEFVTSGFHR